MRRFLLDHCGQTGHIHFYRIPEQGVRVENDSFLITRRIYHDEQFCQYGLELRLALYARYPSDSSVIDLCFPLVSTGAFPPINLMRCTNDALRCVFAVLLIQPFFRNVGIGCSKIIDSDLYGTIRAVGAFASGNSIDDYSQYGICFKVLIDTDYNALDGKTPFGQVDNLYFKRIIFRHKFDDIVFRMRTVTL